MVLKRGSVGGTGVGEIIGTISGVEVARVEIDCVGSDVAVIRGVGEGTDPLKAVYAKIPRINIRMIIKIILKQI